MKQWLLILSLISLNSYGYVIEILESSSFNSTYPIAYGCTQAVVGDCGRILLDQASGNGTTFNGPRDIYVPIDSGGTTRNSNYLLDNTPSNSGGNSASEAVLGLTVTQSTGSELRVQIAQADADQDESDLDVINISRFNDLSSSTNYINLSSGASTTVYFNLYDIYSSVDVNQSDFESDDKLIYVFLSDSNGTVSSGSTPDTSGANADGIYIKVNISDRIPSPTALITQVYRGENRLSLEFVPQGTLTNHQGGIFKTLVLANSSANDYPNQNYSAADKSIAHFAYPSETDAILPDLTNGTSYSYSVSYLNKYLFMANFQTCGTQCGKAPDEFEKFIEAQQCYLLSAGFQKEHFILDYFRSIRDRILLNFDWGKKFVDFYYKTAPDYVGVILENIWLAKSIRGAALITFVIINVLVVLFVFSLFALGIYSLRKVRL